MAKKFNRTVFPAGMLLFEGQDCAHLDANAFYWNIVFREVAKGLGVKETVNGKGTVAEALGNEALTMERPSPTSWAPSCACRRWKPTVWMPSS